MSVEIYGDNNQPTAIVIRKEAKSAGITFFTPQNYSQQLGLMTRPAGYLVPPHKHNMVERVIKQTQEFLFIRNGICRITLYDDQQNAMDLIYLESGDAILLAQGGHGIEMLSECEILEVKQGPYAGPEDKLIF